MLCLHGFKKVVLVTSAKLLIIIPLGYVHNIRYRMKSNGTELEQVVHSHRRSFRSGCSGGSREGARGAWLPLISLEQTEAQRAEKPLSQGRDDCPPPLSEELDPPLGLGGRV